MLTLNDLSYSYRKGKKDAVASVTATIAPGIHLLLGENGAGKTTLLRLLAGVITPTTGACAIDGAETAVRVPSTLQRVFFMPDSMELPARTIRRFAAIHSGYYPGFSSEMFEQNLADFTLTGDETFATLSLGMKHKTLLAYVLALGVDLLLLDEPANGLDISSKKALRAMLGRCVSEEQTVIISTHTVSDLRELYDGLIVLSHGHLLLCRPTWEIAERIACVATPIPPADKLFMDQEAGMFHSIVVNTSGEPASLNYSLIYSALLSPAGPEILDIING